MACHTSWSHPLRAFFSHPCPPATHHAQASAVAYCHQHKIVHRDLKPENVVFKGEEHENVKVTDFGLSNNFKEDELMKTMCGSLCYSAPEVLLSEPYYGPAADVWSLGIPGAIARNFTSPPSVNGVCYCAYMFPPPSLAPPLPPRPPRPLIFYTRAGSFR